MRGNIIMQLYVIDKSEKSIPNELLLNAELIVSIDDNIVTFIKKL